MSEKPFLAEVKRQYEAYPYPPRDPADERRRLVHNVPGCLLAINHHCFAGRRDFRSGFRCLVAGAGTGDSVIFLAEQLRHFDAEVVYLDMSGSSRRIAEERAAVRGLGNITWITASIMDLPGLSLGLFDYIECSGVLHHLESTEAGLQALNAVLRDDGAIYLMLYGRYGRQAVYDMQALLRQYLPADASMADKVRMTRQLLAALPPGNGFMRDMDSWRWEIGDHGFGDAGLYDLLLHSQDRCFDVPALYALARSAGLHLLSFAWRADAYDPLNHVSDRTVRMQLARLGQETQQALAEQMVGDLRMHEFFLARQPGRGATLDDEDNALRSYQALLHEAPRIAAAMPDALAPGAMVRFQDGAKALNIPATPTARVIYAHMDGKTSIGDLRRLVLQSVGGSTPASFQRELEFVYGQLHPRGYLYLLAAGSYGVGIPDYAKLMASPGPAA